MIGNKPGKRDYNKFWSRPSEDWECKASVKGKDENPSAPQRMLTGDFFVGGVGDRDSSASNKGRNGRAFHRMIAQGFRLVVRRLEMPAP